MKYLAILVSIALLAGCVTTQQSQYRGEGARDTQGNPTGSWTLYRVANNGVLGKGNFTNGNPEGLWVFYDSAGTKVADLNFKNGKLNGAYQFYYTSFGDQNAKGKLKTVGSAKDGSLSGRFVRYAPDGSVVVDFTSDGQKILDTQFGTKAEAKNQLGADAQYLHLLFNALADATK